MMNLTLPPAYLYGLDIAKHHPPWDVVDLLNGVARGLMTSELYASEEDSLRARSRDIADMLPHHAELMVSWMAEVVQASQEDDARGVVNMHGDD